MTNRQAIVTFGSVCAVVTWIVSWPDAPEMGLSRFLIWSMISIPIGFVIGAVGYVMVTCFLAGWWKLQWWITIPVALVIVGWWILQVWFDDQRWWRVLCVVILGVGLSSPVWYGNRKRKLNH